MIDGYYKFGAAAIAVVLAVLGISKVLGADFSTTFVAVLFSLALFGVAWAFVQFGDFYATPTFAVAAALSWFAWWPVLESIAMDGAVHREEMRMGWFPTQWYESDWLLLGLEGALLMAAIGTFFFSRSNRY